MNTELRDKLKTYYKIDVARRDQMDIFDWKLRERQRFVDEVAAQNGKSILEIGAGTGRDSLHFKELGFEVSSIDLSPAMVECCREKGLNAYAMDMAQMSFEEAQFDAVYALNSLLHIPDAEHAVILAEVKRVIKSGGLFFYGVYGGKRFEGIREEDAHEPKRFFNFYTDEQIQQRVSRYFEPHYFAAISVERDADFHFQSMIVRK